MVLLLASCVSAPQDQAVFNINTHIAVPKLWQKTGFVSKEVLQPESIRRGLLNLFDLPALEQVVNLAVMNNFDIASAALRLQEADLTLQATQAMQFPSVTAAIGRTQNRSASSMRSTEYSSSLDVSWEVDVWGRLRQQSKAQQAQAQARSEDYEFARESVAAQTMQSWFDVVSAQRQLQVQEARVGSLENTQESIKQRYLGGLNAITDLDSARTRLAQAQASQIQSQEDLARFKRKLQVFIGAYPNAKILVGNKFPAVLKSLSPGLPAEILSRRPDLRAAWQTVLEADANTRVSYSEMFPRISLTGSMGRQGKGLSQLLSAPSSWSLASNLITPLFNAGRLRRQYSVVQKQAERAYLAFLKASLAAFLEVENALSQEHSLHRREATLQQALEHARHTYNGAERDYRDGSINVLGLLSAQQSMFDTESSLIALRNERIQNRISLALALGVGI